MVRRTCKAVLERYTALRCLWHEVHDSVHDNERSKAHSTYSIRCPVVLPRRPDRQKTARYPNAFASCPVVLSLSRQLSRAKQRRKLAER
eukprot:5095293-Prymnesium_polylepis.1